MKRKGHGTTSPVPAHVISAGSPVRHGTLTIIPVVRMVRWGAGQGYGASGEPLGLLLVEDGAAEMRIIPFMETSGWWDAFCAAYPGFAGVVPRPPADAGQTDATTDA